MTPRLTCRPLQATLPLTLASHAERKNTAWKNAMGSGKATAAAGPKFPTLRKIHQAWAAYAR